jgi:hypothetical protein
MSGHPHKTRHLFFESQTKQQRRYKDGSLESLIPSAIADINSNVIKSQGQVCEAYNNTRLLIDNASD